MASGPSPWYTQTSPTLGQHTEEILHELLGLAVAGIARLRADGIIGERPLGL